MSSFDDHSVILDMRSSGSVIIPPVSTANIDIPLTEARYLTGLRYFRYGGNFEDTASFMVVMVIGGVTTVLNQFATDILLGDEGKYEFYKATVPAGLIARVVYVNSGPLSAKFGFNLICHKDK